MMEYFYNQGINNDDLTFLLLHGTGGNEYDLLFASQAIDMKKSVLGIKGEVNESGHLRFFKRDENGRFDIEDLMARTHALDKFLQDTSKKENFALNKLLPIGYSNGANMAVNYLLHYPEHVEAAILFHPSAPTDNIVIPDLTGKKIFISIGATDTMVLPGDSLKLKRKLEAAGADVTFHITDLGHELIEEELQAAKEWYKQL